jgi:hypothetical protein
MCQPPRTPWWLLPNLLALDAPLVATVWQRFLADSFDVTVPWAATIALAATVWCVYLADRWLDARQGNYNTDRHRVAANWPRTFVVGILLATCVAALAAARLSFGYLECGLAIGLGVTVYLALVHCFAGSLGLVPGAKEFLVGVCFAAGVAIPLYLDGPPAHYWLPGVTAFGVCCWLNCRLIDRWESGDTSVSWGDGLLGSVLLAGSVALPTSVGAAIAGSTLGLLAVHISCRHCPRVARVLADAVLLTPLAFWGVS